MRADALHGRVAAAYFGDDVVAGLVVKPAGVADLSAGVGVEGRVVEYDFAFLSGGEHGHALACLRVDDSQHFAATRFGLAIAFELSALQVAIGRRCRLLVGTLPTGLCTCALLVHGAIETGLIEL